MIHHIVLAEEATIYVHKSNKTVILYYTSDIKNQITEGAVHNLYCLKII